MRCNKCGQNTADDAVFCGFCGAVLTQEYSAPEFFSAPSSLTDDVEPPFAMPQPPHGAEYIYAPEPQRPSPDTEYSPYIEKAEASPRSKKKGWIFAAVALIIAVAVVLVLVLTNISGGPLEEILDAIGNTFKAGSFTAEVNYYHNGSLQGSYQVGAEYDMQDGDMTMIFQYDENSFYAIYEGYAIAVYEDDYGDIRIYKTDISDELDEVFEYCEELESADLDDLNLEELLDDLNLPSDVRRLIRKYINLDEAQDGFESVMSRLNDQDWLEENLGYEVSEKNGVTTYSFEIDGKGLREVIGGILEEFESALDEDLYDELEDEFRDIDRDVEISFEICVEGNCVSSAEFTFSDGYDEGTVFIEIDYVGNTEIDTDGLSYYLKRAERLD